MYFDTAYEYGKYVIKSQIDLYPLECLAQECISENLVFKLHSDPLLQVDTTNWFLNIHYSDEAVFLSLGRDRDVFVFQFPQIATFQVSPATGTIDCFPEEGAPSNTLVHLLLDQVLPRLISHLGALSLHAGAVLVQGAAALFCGESGWGKSTLALSFNRHGYPAFSDDIIIIEPEAANFVAHAPYAGLRLWPETITALGGRNPATTLVSHHNSKARLAVSSNADSNCVPIRCVFLLCDPASRSQSINIKPVAPAEAVMALVKAKFRLDTENRATLQQELHQFAALVETIPFYQLNYPRRFNHLPQVRQAILSQLARTS